MKPNNTKPNSGFVKETNPAHPPIVIGGLGGSGTRVVAEIIQTLGIHIGRDLNRANDNLWFSYLFRYPNLFNAPNEEVLKRFIILKKATFHHDDFTSEEFDLIKSYAAGDESFSKDWYASRFQSLTQSNESIPLNRKWGWKEPNSHLFIKQLLELSPDMKYIHVIRDGLDMAFSKNQNQLKLWGEHLMNSSEVSPANMLRFWCIANQRIKDIKDNTDYNILFVNFDDLCDRPDYVICHIMEYLGIDVDHPLFLKARSLVKTPTSKERYKQYDISQFPKKNLDTLESFGYSIEKSHKNDSFAKTPRSIFVVNASLGWSLSPNAKIKPSFRNNVIQTTDKHGWRTVEHTPSDAKKRLAFYGCSFTFGTGLANDETFTSLLQNRFQNLKILNRGIGGHGNTQNYIQFRKDADQGKVDLAVFCLISDHIYRNVGHPVRMKAFLRKGWQALGVEHMPRVKLDSFGNVEIEYIPIWQPSLLRNDFSVFLPPSYYLYQATLAILQKIKDFAHIQNIPVKFVILDSLDQDYNVVLKERFPEVFDISTPYNKDFTFLPDDIHPNMRANYLYYQRLCPIVNTLIK